MPKSPNPDEEGGAGAEAAGDVQEGEGEGPLVEGDAVQDDGVKAQAGSDRPEEVDRKGGPVRDGPEAEGENDQGNGEVSEKIILRKMSKGVPVKRRKQILAKFVGKYPSTLEDHSI